ncbi:hypothetical protein ACXYX3_08400 [Mycobacterium sp. C3-094]
MARKITTLLAGAVSGAALAAAVLAAPVADAQPGFTLPGPGVCNYPGTSGGGGIGPLSMQFCNYPPLLAGMHYHCQWFGGAKWNSGSCNWRWPDNSVAPAPPPEQVFW